MPNTLKLTNTLADETRYSIYQYVLQEGKEVNVHEIADCIWYPSKRGPDTFH